MEGNSRADTNHKATNPLPWCPPQRNLLPTACQWASDLQEQKPPARCLQVSGEDLEQGMPLSFPKQDIKGEEASTSLRKKFLVKKARIPLYSSIHSPAFPPRISVTAHLPHSLPQMFLREEKGFQTVVLLNSPKTWV